MPVLSGLDELANQSLTSGLPFTGDLELAGPVTARLLCQTLRVFMEDTSQRAFEWVLAQQRRQHVHSRIDAAELPVIPVTRRQGRPYTLVLKKTAALFARHQEARTRDETDLGWLGGKLKVIAGVGDSWRRVA